MSILITSGAIIMEIKVFLGWGCSSVVEILLRMSKALDSLLRTAKKKIHL
jgi:hypothetical protein